MTRQQPELVGLDEVARVTGRSLATVRRALPQLRENGAEKRENVWHVPVSAVLGQGWTIDDANVWTAPDEATRHDASRDTSGAQRDASSDVSPREVDGLRAKVRELEARLVAAEAKGEKWQAIAAERGLALDDLRRSLRVIEARNVENVAQDSAHGSQAPEPTPAVPTHPVEAERPAERPGRGLFSRLRGR